MKEEKEVKAGKLWKLRKIIFKNKIRKIKAVKKHGIKKMREEAECCLFVKKNVNKNTY